MHRPCIAIHPRPQIPFQRLRKEVYAIGVSQPRFVGAYIIASYGQVGACTSVVAEEQTEAAIFSMIAWDKAGAILYASP